MSGLPGEVRDGSVEIEETAESVARFFLVLSDDSRDEGVKTLLSSLAESLRGAESAGDRVDAIRTARRAVQQALEASDLDDQATHVVYICACSVAAAADEATFSLTEAGIAVLSIVVNRNDAASVGNAAIADGPSLAVAHELVAWLGSQELSNDAREALGKVQASLEVDGFADARLQIAAMAETLPGAVRTIDINSNVLAMVAVLGELPCAAEKAVQAARHAILDAHVGSTGVNGALGTALSSLQEALAIAGPQTRLALAEAAVLVEAALGGAARTAASLLAAAVSMVARAMAVEGDDGTAASSAASLSSSLLTITMTLTNAKNVREPLVKASSQLRNAFENEDGLREALVGVQIAVGKASETLPTVVAQAAALAGVAADHSTALLEGAYTEAMAMCMAMVNTSPEVAANAIRNAFSSATEEREQGGSYSDSIAAALKPIDAALDEVEEDDNASREALEYAKLILVAGQSGGRGAVGSAVAKVVAGAVATAMAVTQDGSVKDALKEAHELATAAVAEGKEVGEECLARLRELVNGVWDQCPEEVQEALQFVKVRLAEASQHIAPLIAQALRDLRLGASFVIPFVGGEIRELLERAVATVAGTIDSSVLLEAQKLAEQALAAATEARDELRRLVVASLQRACASLAAAYAAAPDVILKILSNIPTDVTEPVKEAAQEVTSTAKNVMVTGAAALDDLVDMPEVKLDAWTGTLDPMYTAGEEVVSAILAAAGKFQFDFALFDIIRDFVQIIGLFFSGFEWPRSFEIVWGTLCTIMSFDWDTLSSFLGKSVNDIRSILHFAVFYALLLASVVCMAVFVYVKRKVTPEALDDGLEAAHWATTSKKDTRLLRITLTALTTMYLPITVQSTKVLVCGGQWNKFFVCYESNHVYLCVLAVAMMAMVTFYVPVMCYKLIQANKPVARGFDEEGEEVEYSNEMYHSDLLMDKCPYKFMYDGYEHKWAFYKVIVMGLKLAIALPVVLLAENAIVSRKADEQGSVYAYVQAGAVVVLLGIFACLSFYSTPFIKNSNDLIDMFARVTALLTALAAGVAAVAGFQDSLVLGVLLNVMHFGNFISMASLTAMTIPFIERKFRSTMKRLALTEDANSGTPLVFSEGISLPRERKRRVWHAFWDGLLLGHPSFAPPADTPLAFTNVPNVPPYLQHFTGTVGERHLENKEIVTRVGLTAIKAEMGTLPNQEVADRKYAVERLMGLDVYWAGEVADGQNDSRTFFGKMYIVPFPFTIVMTFDDSDDHVVIHRNLFNSFIRSNQDGEVQRRRYVRTQLRALAWGCSHYGDTLRFDHQATITKTKSRQVEYEDENGSTLTKTEHYQVSVDMTFHVGVASLSFSDPSDVFTCMDGNTICISKGFDFAVTLTDGQGVDHEGTHWTNEHLRLDPGIYGLNCQYQPGPSFDRLLQGSRWSERFGEVQARYAEYRDFYAREFSAKSAALSYYFWYYVYHDDTLPREGLLRCLSNEVHPGIRAIPQDHKEGLDAVYARIKFINSHAGVAYWFVFFDDIWRMNSSLPDIQEHQSLLDPSHSESLAYRVMKRPQLEEILEEAGLRGYFDDELLNKFFNTLERVCAGELGVQHTKDDSIST